MCNPNLNLATACQQQWCQVSPQYCQLVWPCHRSRPAALKQGLSQVHQQRQALQQQAAVLPPVAQLSLRLQLSQQQRQAQRACKQGRLCQLLQPRPHPSLQHSQLCNGNSRLLQQLLGLARSQQSRPSRSLMPGRHCRMASSPTAVLRPRLRGYLLRLMSTEALPN